MKIITTTTTKRVTKQNKMMTFIADGVELMMIERT